MSDKCRRDYRNRLNRFIDWLSTKPNYEQYYLNGTREITDEERADETMFYFNIGTRDLIYAGLRVDIFKAYLSEKKLDEDGNRIIKSPQNVRKYGDAIIWGAETAGERLSTDYFHQMEKYSRQHKRRSIVWRGKEG